MKLQNIFVIAFLAFVTTANAETILLEEDFDGDYSKSFPFLFDGDSQEPHPSIASIFYSNATGSYMPWWVCRDSKDSTDRFMASHSYYYPAGKSNDWIISLPLDIDSEGYVLEFDAQCVNVRGTEYISDLSLFITDWLIDPTNVPETPTHVFADVPYGDDLDLCGGDWTHYVFSLDDYAGKTILVNFVNKNNDKDILCIDNVKVWRDDPVELTLNDYVQYCVSETAEVSVTVEVTDQEGLENWKAILESGDVTLGSWEGESMVLGESQTFSAEIPVVKGKQQDFKFTIWADNCARISAGGQIIGMSYVPVHRVFYEETTSMHCGNCTLGMYVTESLVSDPTIDGRVIPVSVHLAALGYDPMATNLYYPFVPVNDTAPVIFVDREKQVEGLNPGVDAEYNPENPYSFAYRIARRLECISPLGVEVEADWVIEGQDTTAVMCKAKVRPAYNLEDAHYRVAFILTENNVGLDRNAYWIQENYLAGKNYASRCGGWCDLPQMVINARYHDVARAVSNYNGHANSLPTMMEMDKDYEYTFKLKIPDTKFDSNGYHLADPICRANCEVTAIVIDETTETVVNAARVPMSEQATHRYSAEDLVRDLDGIDNVTVDAEESGAVYYDVMGRQVANPNGGVYIRRTPSTITKLIK